MRRLQSIDERTSNESNATALRKTSAPTELILLSIAFFLLFMGGGAQQQFVAPYLEQTTTWSPVQRTCVLAMVYFSFALWRLNSAYFTHLLGERLTIVLGSFTYALFPCTLALTRSFALLLLTAFIWGWGAALNWNTTSIRILNVTVRNRYGAVAGVLYGATHLGFTIGVLLLGTVLHYTNSHRTMFLIASAIALMGCALPSMLPHTSLKYDTPSFRRLTTVLLTRYGVTIAFFLFMGAFGFGILLSSFAELAARGATVQWFAAITALFPFARFCVSITGGIASDKFGRGLVLAFAFALAAVALLLITLFPHSPMALGGAALAMGIQAGIAPAIVMALVGDITNPRERHVTYGALFIWSDLGVATAMIGSQVLRQLMSSFRASFVTFACIFALCALLSIMLDRWLMTNRR